MFLRRFLAKETGSGKSADDHPYCLVIIPLCVGKVSCQIPYFKYFNCLSNLAIGEILSSLGEILKKVSQAFKNNRAIELFMVNVRVFTSAADKHSIH